MENLNPQNTQFTMTQQEARDLLVRELIGTRKSAERRYAAGEMDKQLYDKITTRVKHQLDILRRMWILTTGKDF